jgi:hypothetical protein
MSPFGRPQPSAEQSKLKAIGGFVNSTNRRSTMSKVDG